MCAIADWRSIEESAFRRTRRSATRAGHRAAAAKEAQLQVRPALLGAHEVTQDDAVQLRLPYQEQGGLPLVTCVSGGQSSTPYVANQAAHPRERSLAEQTTAAIPAPRRQCLSLQHPSTPM